MKKNIKEWYPIFVALSGIADCRGLLANPTLPSVPRLRLTRLHRELLPNIQKFETDKVEVFKSLGTLSEDGKLYEFRGEANLKVADELKALLDVEVEISFTPIPDVEMRGMEPPMDDSMARAMLDLFVE